MEVFQADDFYIFVQKQRTLWWHRKENTFTTKNGWDLSAVHDVECLGITEGIIGVIRLPSQASLLVVVRESQSVGCLVEPHLVYKIRSVCILGTEGADSPLIVCQKHRTSRSAESSAASSPSRGRSLVGKTWGVMKSAGGAIKSTTQHALGANQTIKDPNRLERKISEELHKIFDETDSFYFCPDADITNNLQRQKEGGERDDRFFWNKTMAEPLQEVEGDGWLLPVIQGFVQMESCVIGNDCFTLALVSRRSRHRAGTRYNKRGVDEDGHCANYVETEQILSLRGYQLSFTQVRGSVPVFWSQPGFSYRPPPRLDRNDADTQAAFARHFEQELSVYGQVTIINLVEQTGKERVIGDAYARHIVQFNSDRLAYVSFDFHAYCRGMRFENVSVLIEALARDAGRMSFHWRDKRGTICDQRAVFRVNCIDCLDRTNVVQTAIGRTVLESQLVKLGLIPPYSNIPERLRQSFMVLWAENGDKISLQYAGTNALKGDYTRTGERKLAGIMKDGMNSANRYYLARFKDNFRQATIDLMMGRAITQDAFNREESDLDENEAVERAEHARLLVEDCRRLLIGSDQLPIGAWGLIDATSDPNETEVDTILLLTDDTYISAEYEAQLDKVVQFEEVKLDAITSLELGSLKPTKFFSHAAPFYCLRINYAMDGKEGFSHSVRSPNIRFFNNVAVVIRKPEEMFENLHIILEYFRIALDNRGRTNVLVTCGTGHQLQTRKGRSTLGLPTGGMPRNLSESQLVQFGSKALSNVAGQFSKLSQTLKPRGGEDEAKNDFLPSVGIVMSAAKEGDSSSPDDDEVVIAKLPAPADVHALSITSVTDRISMPKEMLACSSPMRSRSPAPEIRVEDFVRVDASDLPKDLSLPLNDAASSSRVSPLSPIAALAKGVQSIGSNLDPRKITSKGGALLSPTATEPAENFRQKLEDLWAESECRTKLIAL